MEISHSATNQQEATPTEEYWTPTQMLLWAAPVSWRATKHPGMVKQTIDQFCAELSKCCSRGEVGAQWRAKCEWRAKCDGGERYVPSNVFEDIPWGLWGNGLVFPWRDEGEITDKVNYICGNAAFTLYALAVDVQFRRSDVERRLKSKKLPCLHALATRQEALATAIASRLARGERPGIAITWKEFCCSVRDECNGWADPKRQCPKRGFGDKTIERLVQAYSN